MGQLAQGIQAVVDEPCNGVIDQSYTGAAPAAAAAQVCIHLEVVIHQEAKHGFMLLPRRWAVERYFVWTALFRRLVLDYEQLPATLAGYHLLAFASLMLATLFGKS